MSHQRRPAEAIPQVGDPAGQHVGALLPRHHGAGRHHPLVGVERAQVDVGVEPRVELDGAQFDAVGADPVDRSDDGPGHVVAGLGAVPVGGAVVRPVARAAAEGVGPAAGADRARPFQEDRGPSVQAVPGSVAGDHGEVGGEPGGDPVQITRPPATHRAPVEPHGHVVEGVQRCHQQRAAVGRAEQERPAGGWAVGEQEEAVQLRSHHGREGELAVLVGQGPEPFGRAVVQPFGRGERGPRHRRLVVGAGGQAAEVDEGFGAEHHHRPLRQGAQRAADRAVVGHHHLGGRTQVGVDQHRLGGTAGERRPSRPPRPEPVGLTPRDADRAVGGQVDGEVGSGREEVGG